MSEAQGGDAPQSSERPLHSESAGDGGSTGRGSGTDWLLAQGCRLESGGRHSRLCPFRTVEGAATSTAFAVRQRSEPHTTGSEGVSFVVEGCVGGGRCTGGGYK